MRTVYFPIERETKETIKYLLDTVLVQTGSITFDTANGRLTIETIEHPESCSWHADYTYFVRLWKRPDQCKYSRAKYIGITTNSLDDAMDFVMAYRQTEEVTAYHAKTKAKRVREYREVEPEVSPCIDDWND